VTVVFAVAAVFFLGALLSVILAAESCDSDAAAGPFLVLGLLCAGGAAFNVARSLTDRPWIVWTWAVAVPMALGVGVYVLTLLSWVGACAN
jgi:hypothetical protein